MPAAWVSAAAAVYGATQSGGSGGTSGGSSPPTYQMMASPAMDSSFQNNYNNYQSLLNSSWGKTNPYTQSYLTSAMSNPYAKGYQAGDVSAGKEYMGGAANAGNASAQMFNASGNIYNTAFDPRSAIYNQNVQQLQDNVRAGEYARGIQMSPYGAAVEGNVMGNFQNDWQNQQLQRQLSGINAMSRGDESAAGLANTSGAMYMAGGQAPYAGYGAINNDRLSAIQNYWGSMNPYLAGINQQQSNALGYINHAQAAQQQGWNQNAYNQQQTMNAIGQIAGPVGNAVKNWWNSTPTPTPSDYSGGGDGGGGTDSGGMSDSWSSWN